MKNPLTRPFPLKLLHQIKIGCKYDLKIMSELSPKLVIPVEHNLRYESFDIKGETRSLKAM